jgi:DNA-binding transcriptional regulator YdaS (Cro superfamily)
MVIKYGSHNVKQETRAGKSLPWIDTDAVRMLAGAISLAKRQGTSQAELGKSLGYSSTAVLSHMATGRVAIPVERAAEIARAVGLDEAAFTLAVLRQRFPEIDFQALAADAVRDPEKATLPPRSVALKLERLAGSQLEELGSDVLDVLESVVRDKNPSRRWLTIKELPVVESIRLLRPHFRERGLTIGDINAVEEVLRG